MPNITASTEAGKLEQIRSYLYTVSQKLNWAFNTIETSYNSPSASTNIKVTDSNERSPEEVQASFNDIKALIIKSADIVDAYYETISKKLEGLYVASSDFGEYKEQTSATIKESSTDITTLFTNIQSISSSLEGIRNELIDTKAYIRTGIVAYDESGKAIYGLEIGQTDTIGGEEVFDKFSRFTADRLSFYDNNDTEVAYVSDEELVITIVRVLGNLYFGGITSNGYKIDTSDGIAFVWEDREEV